MKLCGLTGGVGMGKSTAASFFEKRGARVVDTDGLARELVRPGQPALAEIQSVFGQDIVSPDGHLRREVLANRVFGNIGLRRELEAILHPRIRACWLARIQEWRAANCPLAVVVIPLLFETGAETHFDKIICVACSENARRERLARRGWTDGQIDQRIAAQMAVTEKISRADFVIWSEGDLENHERQIDCVLRALPG